MRLTRLEDADEDYEEAVQARWTSRRVKRKMQEAKTGDGESKRQRTEEAATDDGRRRRPYNGKAEGCHGADVPWAAIDERENVLLTSLSLHRS
jgi:hypothetical protein